MTTSALFIAPRVNGPVLHLGRTARGRAGTAISIALHGAALGALWFASTQPSPPPRERTIALTFAPPEPARPPVALAAPSPIAQPQARRAPTAAPPRRVSAMPARAAAVAPATSSPASVGPAVAAPAGPTANAETPTAPAAAAAPAARPAPRMVVTAGISSDYVTKVFERINRYAADSYPRAARLRREEGRVAYRLTLDADGRVQRVDITPSGNDDLDAAAREAIRAAAPFPKPPDLGASAYQLAGAIVYQLTD